MSTTLNHFSIVNQVESTPEHTVVLVGTALDGPSNIPFSLFQEVNPYDVLGSSPLAHAYNAARRAGAQNIVAYRLNGNHSFAKVTDKFGLSLITLISVSAADRYDDIQVIKYPDHLYVEGTNGVVRNYFYDKYKTVSDLVYAINRDAHYGLLEFQAEALEPQYVLMNMVDNPTYTVFTSGSSESHLINYRDPHATRMTNPSLIVPELKERLKVALFGEDLEDILERQPNSSLGAMHYGVITICDMYHDDDPELTEMLGSFCLNKTKEIGFGCVAVIGTRPIYQEEDENEIPVPLSETVHREVLKLVGLNQYTNTDELYKYVQVIVGHTNYPESENESIPVSVGYAATQALLPYHVMMTNKSISGLGKLNFSLTKEDVALLSANGYTCIVPSIRKGIVPYLAVSYSKDKASISSKPHCIRISQYVSHMLTEELDYLIGEVHSVISMREVMKSAKEMLNSLITDGVIKDYEISHEISESQTELSIELSLTPFSEIQSVSSISVVSFPQGVSI